MKPRKLYQYAAGCVGSALPEIASGRDTHFDRASKLFRENCTDRCTSGEFITRMMVVFPFAFVIDDSLIINVSGPLLQKTYPQIRYRPQLGECFRFAQDAHASFSRLAERAGELMVLQSTAALPPLRGQWLRVAERQMIFLGWPWVTSFGQLSGMG